MRIIKLYTTLWNLTSNIIRLIEKEKNAKLDIIQNLGKKLTIRYTILIYPLVSLLRYPAKSSFLYFSTTSFMASSTAARVPCMLITVLSVGST